MPSTFKTNYFVENKQFRQNEFGMNKFVRVLIGIKWR